jgi:2-oxoacid:acceptor oxidoreductase gamma subunit (pyruvate/2-ketoisovalerate family)
MLAICFHGRGGQGSVIASKLLAKALFHEGWQVQAIPSFSAERTGAPVVAFVRADHRHITTHCHVYEPDYVVVLDPMLMKNRDVTSGMKRGGWVLVNSPATPNELDLPRDFGIATCDATDIALRHGLGTRTRPIVNTAMVGAFVSLTGLLSLESVIAEIPAMVPVDVEDNQAAAQDAFDHVRRLPAETAVRFGQSAAAF